MEVRGIVGQIMVLMIAVLLTAPSLTAGSGAGARAPTDPDLAVWDISCDDDLKVTTRILNIGGHTEGIFTVNLSLDGKYFGGQPVYWSWETMSLNITFQQSIPWLGAKIHVMVEIYDPQQMIADANASNDRREERWERSLPDLEPVSIFTDAATGETCALVRNMGQKATTYGFDTELSVNGSKVATINWKPSIVPGGMVRLSSTWKWDRSVSPVTIKLWVDSSELVKESDENDNVLAIVWANRPRPVFISSPEVVGTEKGTATIEWETNVPTSAQVEYGRSTRLGLTSSSRALSKEGNIHLSGLSPASQYIFRVACSDGYGRMVESPLGSFMTRAPDPTGKASGGFVTDLMMNLSGKMRVPFSTSDPTGVRKVDFYLGGKLIGSKAGSGKGSVDGAICDFSKLAKGDQMITAKVLSMSGEETLFTSTCRIENPMLGHYPKVSFLPPSTDIRGTEMFYARCEDPLGIANVTWFIDDVQVELSVPRHPESSFHGATFWWDSRSVDDGEHTVEVQVRNNVGNLTTARGRITVDNLLDPPDPDIWVRRENIGRDGTVLTVTLEVSNHGRGTARNIRVIDNLRGFLPLDGDVGTRAPWSDGIDWEVVLEVDELEPDDVIDLVYRCIPILYDTDEWYIGSEIADPDRPGHTYTTSYTFDREDGLVSYTRRTWVPTTNFEEGYIMRAGALHTISTSNYVMMTNPVRLINNLAFTGGYTDFFQEVGLLLERKDGVFGFINNVGGVSPSTSDILATIDGWADLLDPEFGEKGYLAILGEDDIIPTWTYAEAVGSDHGYSLLGGGTVPKLIVGRFLGSTPDELLTPVRASLEVARGNKLNDPENDALLISGSGDGVFDFYTNMADLDAAIDPTMDTVLHFQRGNYLPIQTSDVPFDGKSPHMTAGDMDANGDNEIMVLDPVNDLIRVLHPGTGTKVQFSVASEEEDQIMLFTDSGTEYIGHLFDDDGRGRLDLYDEDGHFFFGYNDLEWTPGDGMLALDVDMDGYDDLLTFSVGNDELVIEGLVPERHDMSDIHPDPRVAAADMDDDGDLDIVLADHQDDVLRVLFWPPGAGTWSETIIPCGGLEDSDGFGAGNFLPSNNNNRGEALVLQHGSTGYLQICWLEADPVSGSLIGKSEKSHFLSIGDGCSLEIVEGPLGPERDEVLVGNEADRALVLDYSGCTGRFQSAVDPYMDGQDLIVYRDHGNEGAWSGYVDSTRLDLLGIGSLRHIPVMVGLVCLSGRFHDQTNSFAQSAMRNGGGVYIGATMVSDRSENNRAIAFIEDYVSGTPIGVALRDYKADYITASATSGHHWSRMYNYYGDPGFGTDGHPYGAGTRALPPRSDGLDITVPSPQLYNMTGGTGVSIPGGYDIYEIGRPVVQFYVERVPLPPGTTVSSVSATMNGTWEYLQNISMPIYDGPQYDNMADGPRDVPDIDPDDGWYPQRSFDWEVVDGGDYLDLLVRTYPFQYDGASLRARFCQRWSISYVTEDVATSIEDVRAEGWTSGTLLFSFTIDGPPLGTNVSLTTWISRGPDVIKELSFADLTVNGTTQFEDGWDTSGMPPSTYSYVVELRSGTGTLLHRVELPFDISGPEPVRTSLVASTGVFGTGTLVNASAYFENPDPEVSIKGFFELALLDNRSDPLSWANGTLTIGPGGNVSRSMEFDMTGLSGDLYALRATFESDGVRNSVFLVLRRNGTIPLPPAVHSLSLESNLSAREIIEGGSLFINGTVLRDDGAIIPYLPIGAWLGDRNWTDSGLTGANGSFSLELVNLTTGNWTGAVMARAGPSMTVMVPFQVIVLSPPIDNGTGDDDDNLTDDDDDNITDDDDDNVTDDDSDDVEDDDDLDDEDTDDDGGDDLTIVLIAVSVLGIIILLLIVMAFLAVIMRRRGKERELDWEE